MRDFCVAVSAVIPILLLALSAEFAAHGHLHTRFVKRIAQDHGDVGARFEEVHRESLWRDVGRVRLLVLLALLTEVGVLGAIPFTPEGVPQEPWHWLVLSVCLVVVTALIHRLRKAMTAVLNWRALNDLDDAGGSKPASP